MSFHLLAQAYNYSTDPTTTAGAGVNGVVLVIYIAVLVVLIAGMWKLFVKAGHPGWAAIVPIYNSYILLKIAGRPAWWLLLLLIPFVNIVVGILVGMDVAKRFGYSSAFGAIVCGLFGIGYTIIGFSKTAQYNPNVPATQV